MLAPRLSELRPYLYLVLGILLLLTQDNPFAWGWGLSLYLYGARGCVQRVNPLPRPTVRLTRRRLPTRLYEAAPFVYLLAGLLCVLLARHLHIAHLMPLTLAAATLFVGAGLGSWLMRLHHRRDHLQPA